MSQATKSGLNFSHPFHHVKLLQGSLGLQPQVKYDKELLDEDVVPALKKCTTLEVEIIALRMRRKESHPVCFRTLQKEQGAHSTEAASYKQHTLPSGIPGLFLLLYNAGRSSGLSSSCTIPSESTPAFLLDSCSFHICSLSPGIASLCLEGRKSREIQSLQSYQVRGFWFCFFVSYLFFIFLFLVCSFKTRKTIASPRSLSHQPELCT